MKKEWCIYKYVNRDDGNVIYVGKTDSSLKQRIDAHEREDKFQPYRGNWDIYWFRLANRVETDIVEKFLINKLKPILNEKDLEEGLSITGLTLPKWEPYSKYQSEINEDKKEQAKRISMISRDFHFFMDAMDALAAGGTFSSRFLHPTGRLPFEGREVQIANPAVLSKDGLYVQTLTEEGMELLSSFPKRVEASITEEYDIYVPTKTIMLCDQFARRLLEFAENGFQEEEGDERFFLRVDSETEDSIETFKQFSDLFISIYPGYHCFYAEANPDGFKEKVLDMLEMIAGWKISDATMNGYLIQDPNEDFDGYDLSFDFSKF